MGSYNFAHFLREIIYRIMKLFATLILVAQGSNLECYAEQDKFDLGFSNRAVRPTCDPNNSKLYSGVQCDSAVCTCTDSVSGEPDQPLRQASIKAKDMLVCSGTKCLTESGYMHQLTQDGVADASGPDCDVLGDYKMIQTNGAMGHAYCQDKSGAWSEHAYTNGISNEIPDNGSPVLFCIQLFKSNNWSRDGAI